MSCDHVSLSATGSLLMDRLRRESSAKQSSGDFCIYKIIYIRLPGSGLSLWVTLEHHQNPGECVKPDTRRGHAPSISLPPSLSAWKQFNDNRLGVSAMFISTHLASISQHLMYVAHLALTDGKPQAQSWGCLFGVIPPPSIFLFHLVLPSSFLPLCLSLSPSLPASRLVPKLSPSRKKSFNLSQTDPQNLAAGGGSLPSVTAQTQMCHRI